MKTTKFTALVLTLALLIGCFSVLPVFAEENAESKQLEIVAQNIVYGEKIQIAYAVKCTLEEAQDVTLAYTCSDGTALKASLYKNGEILFDNKATDEVENYPIFVTKGFHANQFTEVVSAVAYIGDEVPTDATYKTYSVAEYLFAQLYKYNYINKTESDGGEDGKDFFRRNLYLSLMNYGTAAQQVINDQSGDLLLTNYCYIWTTDDAVSINGTKSALVKAGTEVSVSGAKSYTSIEGGIAGEPVTFSGQSFTATSAGVYNLSSESLINWFIEDFNNYPLGGSGTAYGVSTSSNLKSFILADPTNEANHVLAAYDGGSSDLFYGLNQTGIDNGVKISDGNNSNSKFTFEADIWFNIFDSKVIIYNYDSSNTDVTKGSNYGFILTFNPDGTLTMANVGAVATAENVSIAAKTWYNIRIEGDTQAGGKIELYVNDVLCATVEGTTKPIVTDSIKLLLPKKSTSTSALIYIDNIGINYYD